jgi:glyoxylase-like metal-dependent hydrolase (beta-lactamase superfamily II)
MEVFMAEHSREPLLPESWRARLTLLTVLACMLAQPLGAQQRPGVLHEVTGPMQTNTYLLYDPTSRVAALIDPGGPAESLVAAVDSLGLRVKYIFVTHAHSDHVYGVPALRARFPAAKWGVSGAELEDMARTLVSQNSCRRRTSPRCSAA